jgi:polar amino acid transport system substrate-binding protein
MTLLMALSLMALGGCAGATGSREIELVPVVSSPAVGTAGVLKVGINSTNAPYAGLSSGNMVGIDVDVASALAEEMGLKIELVDLAGLSADTLLTEGAIDVVMDVEQTGGSVIRGTQIGPYVESGPALFTLVKSSNEVPNVDLQTLAGVKVAAQKDSLSAWSVDELIGSGTSDPRESLAAAFEAVETGQATYAAADAVVGSYLALEYGDLACVKMLGRPIGVYMGVAKDNTQLADALTVALRTLRDNGEMKVILSKWLGPVSALVVTGSSAITAGATSTSSSGTAASEGQIDAGDDLPDPSNANGM